MGKEKNNKNYNINLEDFNFDNILNNDFNKIEDIIKILKWENTYLYENNKQQNEIIFLKSDDIERRNLYDTLQKLNRNKDFKKLLAMYDYNFNTFYADIIDYYKNYKYVENILYEIDFKQKEPIKIEYNPDTFELKIIKSNLNFYFKHADKIKENKVNYYLKLYVKNVFPNFIEFINTIVYIMFDTSRKKSFLHINAPSDWGKTFLIGLFEDLDIGMETDADDLFKDRTELTTLDFKNKILVAVDEFKIFKSELKKIDRYIKLKPKYKSRTKVQVFAKLLTSAELSASFDEATDDQIINRIIDFSVNNSVKKVQDLIDEGIDKDELHIHLQYFLMNYIKRRIDFIKRNNINTNKKLEKIIEKRKLNVANLEFLLLDLFIDYVETNKMENELRDFISYDKRIVIDDVEKKVYITGFKKWLQDYIKNIVDEQTYKKLQYKFKETQLKNIFNFDYDRETISGKQSRFYIFDLKFLMEKYEALKKKEKFKLDPRDLKIKELKQKLAQKEKLLDEITNKYNELEKKYNELKKEAGKASLNTGNKNYNTTQQKPQLYIEPLDDEDFPF